MCALLHGARAARSALTARPHAANLTAFGTQKFRQKIAKLGLSGVTLANITTSSLFALTTLTDLAVGWTNFNQPLPPAIGRVRTPARVCSLRALLTRDAQLTNLESLYMPGVQVGCPTGACRCARMLRRSQHLIARASRRTRPVGWLELYAAARCCLFVCSHGFFSAFIVHICVYHRQLSVLVLDIYDVNFAGCGGLPLGLGRVLCLARPTC